MKKGMFVRSLFLVGVMFFILLVSGVFVSAAGVGYVDGLSGCTMTGWAKDTSIETSYKETHLYFDLCSTCPSACSDCLANPTKGSNEIGRNIGVQKLYRADGGIGYHGWIYPLSSSTLTLSPGTHYVYGYSWDKNNNRYNLNNFPQTITVQAETCNGIDDDCDETMDEGVLCPSGQNCYNGGCCTPVNSHWGAWGGWSNVGSCGSGTNAGFPCKQQQSRTRTCIGPSCGGSSAVCSLNQGEVEFGYINCGDNENYGCPSGYFCSSGSCTQQCSSGDCCNAATGKYRPSSYNPGVTCKKCTGSSATSVSQTSSEDLWSQCSASYNSCSGSCVKIGPDGYCNGAGFCKNSGLSTNVAQGYVCSGGSEVTTSACGYSSYNKCGSTNNQIPGRDQYRCNGAGSCSYDVGDLFDGTACLGNCNSFCSGGSCRDTVQGQDTYGICSPGYSCIGNNVTNNDVCGPGTSCGNLVVSCTGGENSKCVNGQSSCQNNCSDGVDNDGDGYTDGQDKDCGGGGECTSGDCCNIATGTNLSSATVCRPSTGPCDISEKCTGSSSTCPSVNVFNDPTTICSTVSSPYCASPTLLRTNVTRCNGTSSACPTNVSFFDNTCSGEYPFCSEGACTRIGITDAYWALLNGTRVVNADVNDTVLMVVNGNGLSGKSINYSVCKLGFGGTCWWWTTKENIEEVFGSAPYAVSDAGLYEFTAKVEGFQKTSETLQSYGGRPIDNAHPFTRIILPINELNVSVGEKINFNVSSHDEDDLLKITWDFGDGTTKVITNYVNNPLLAGNSNYNTSAAVTHNYSSSGRYLIKLTAKEMERDQEDSKETYINVFNTGINVFPVISSPIGVINNRTINFNASRSFVANCSTASCPSCPIQIEGGKLNCSYIHKSGNKSVGNYDLNIAWTIEDSPDIKINGSWSLNYSGVVDFLKYLEKSDNRKVELIMKYIPASGAIIPGETSNYFSINEWYCDTSTITGTWRRPGFSSISNNCSKYASLNDGLACCPSYQQCNQNGSCSGNVKYCSQFADWACNTGTPQIVFMNNKNYTCKESIGPDVNHCTTTNICHCILNLTATTHCQDVFSIVKSGAGCTGGGDCTYSSEIQDNCNNTLNNRIVTKIAHWTPVAGETGINPDCQSIVTTEICPVTAKLPFFGNFMMFMSIFFIIVIYLFRIKKKQF